MFLDLDQFGKTRSYHYILLLKEILLIFLMFKISLKLYKIQYENKSLGFSKTISQKIQCIRIYINV